MQRLTLDKSGVIFTRKPNQQYHFKALGLGVRWGLMGGFYVLKKKKKRGFFEIISIHCNGINLFCKLLAMTAEESLIKGNNIS